MRTPLIAGNWKMHGSHLEAIALVQKLAFSLTDKDFDALEVAVLPPFTCLRSVQTMVDGDDLRIRYGAQDLSPHEKGAYTGDISGGMLAKLECTYVVVGHSERRGYHGEDDALVGAKVRAAFTADLIPILCVGETVEVREAGEHVAHTLGQLDAALTGVSADRVRTLVVAYEPVWAIGTGRVCDPADAEEVCSAIRTRLAELYPGETADQARILYGGSVKSANIAGIMDQPNIDGALVGGASLEPEEFVRICRYREHTA
ncbi:MAG: triose-phosphate isomerase [Streptosporangiales bacterium]|nr:triose-phosphate isomerase [Streptosporangiales bacterium]